LQGPTGVPHTKPHILNADISAFWYDVPALQT